MEVKIKADKLVIIVFGVAGFLGFLGAILGFAGEGAHDSVSTTSTYLPISVL